MHCHVSEGMKEREWARRKIRRGANRGEGLRVSARERGRHFCDLLPREVPSDWEIRRDGVMRGEERGDY